MNIVVVIQARLGSTRFPGKILAPLGGRPVLAWVLDRAWAMHTPCVVAVPAKDFIEIGSRTPADARGRALWFSSHRQEADVLGRLVDVARDFKADGLVRVTADSPFIDPALGRRLIAAAVTRALLGTPADYLAPCYPPDRCADGGLDLEFISREALERASIDATAPEDREHPTRYLWQHPDQFVCVKHEDPPGYGGLGIRWMVDTPEDLRRLNEIAEYLPPWETGWQETLNAQRISGEGVIGICIHGRPTYPEACGRCQP